MIEALDRYSQVVNHKVSSTNLLKILPQTEFSSRDIVEKQIIEARLEVERIAEELRLLYQTSTHIPPRLRAELLMYGDFFWEDHSKENLEQFNKRIFLLKSSLRRSVTKIF